MGYFMKEPRVRNGSGLESGFGVADAETGFFMTLSLISISDVCNLSHSQLWQGRELSPSSFFVQFLGIWDSAVILYGMDRAHEDGHRMSSLTLLTRL